MESQQPASPHDRPVDGGAVHDRTARDHPTQEHASGLRMVALASVAALAVVLPLAAATDGPRERTAHPSHSGQTAVDHPRARTSSADGYGPLPRSGRTS